MQTTSMLHRTHARCTRLLAMALIACTLIALLPATPLGTALADETGKVTASSLNIRKTPSTEAEKLRSVKKGTKLTILESDGDWYKVSVGKVVGYVAKKYVTIDGDAPAAAKPSGTIASLGDAPKASKPGDNNNHVKKLQQALSIAGYYTGNITGNYGEKTEQAVRAFQKAKGLSVDGIAGNGTIKALFGSTAAGGNTIKTEKPNWFDGGKNLIPKGAVFTVKDVRTGKTFKARRWSGSNHIDAEPYNSDATKTIKSIYGGSFSWDRRPILILYKDHVYAASMNGMPHGEQTIKGNDFEGHFCVHFYKSKTHGTDKVDSDHQDAVAAAAKATW